MGRMLLLALIGFHAGLIAETEVARLQRMLKETPEESPFYERLQMRLRAVATRDGVRDSDCSILLALQEPLRESEMMIEVGAVTWIFDLSSLRTLDETLTAFTNMERGRVSDRDRSLLQVHGLGIVTRALQQKDLKTDFSKANVRLLADLVYQSSRGMVWGSIGPRSQPLLRLVTILTSWNPKIGTHLQCELLTALLAGIGGEGFRQAPAEIVRIAERMSRIRRTLPLERQDSLYSAVLRAELSHVAPFVLPLAEFLERNPQEGL